ncbi:hypothetical protein H8959_005323, partial [Pygathrix nigripes]
EGLLAVTHSPSMSHLFWAARKNLKTQNTARKNGRFPHCEPFENNVMLIDGSDSRQTFPCLLCKDSGESRAKPCHSSKKEGKELYLC